jgi:hypothetical protein
MAYASAALSISASSFLTAATKRSIERTNEEEMDVLPEDKPFGWQVEHMDQTTLAT